jgi:hypothetical protein
MDLPANPLFIGELKAAWTEKRFMTGECVDVGPCRSL